MEDDVLLHAGSEDPSGLSQITTARATAVDTIFRHDVVVT